MYSLDISFYKRQGIIYFVISIVCFIFSTIYGFFSHGVYSNYMKYGFVIPLVFGCIISICIYLLKVKKLPNKVSNNLYNASVITFYVYSLVRGILEIYGTTNNLLNVYFIVGLLLLIFSIIIYFVKLISKK